MSRLPVLSLEDMTPEQVEVYDLIASGVRGTAGGPFSALLYSPGLTRCVEQLGVYIRYQCAVPERQRELLICMIASHWRADFEWYIHAPLALNLGIPEDVLSKISKGEAPSFVDPADAVAHAFATQTMQTGRVSDSTYDKAVATFGEKGVVDLTGLLGYYSLLAMTLNTFEVEVPEDADIPWAGSVDGAANLSPDFARARTGVVS